MKRAELNYWIDMAIAIAFLISGASGLIFLLPVQFGSADGLRILGLSYGLWDQLHIWGSLAMMAGVGAHLLLHTTWLVAMSKRVLGRRHPAGHASSCEVPSTADPDVSRRRFLRLGGVAFGGSALLAVCGALVSGWVGFVGAEDDDDGMVVAAPKSESAKVTAKDDATLSSDVPPADQPDPHLPASDPAPGAEPDPAPAVVPKPAPTQGLCVLCPKGLVNDPYPGRCRRYRDNDGDGICDYSIPTPCG